MLSSVGISGYGDYKASNYGKNALLVTMGSISIWFSYRTPVAVTDGVEFFITENQWGPTTGKHLNWIDPDKSKRIPNQEFDQRLSYILEKFNLIPVNINT
jgi:hypothetical protein